MTELHSQSGTLFYEESGSGRPLILIHGFPLSGAIWSHQLAGLSGRFRVIAPDLRGFGRSTPSDLPYSMDLYADDTIMLMDHLGIDKAAVCGMSMGGYVLLNLLERYPERVDAACFMVTKAGADDAEGRGRRTALAEEVLKSGAGVAADAFSRILFAPASLAKNPEMAAHLHGAMAEAAPAGLASALLAMRDRPDYTNKLGEFTVRSLVIGAEEDMSIAVEESRKLAAGLRDATLCMIPDAGHMVMMEQPEAVNLALVQFLERI
ncbi:MAG: alpha/beta fold hydrolase [Geobacteraceae bacterium]|nr:alpha/beta fold hydrolase [Geobacteraceae bacterium]